jgi:C4-dicarboxylate-binding protein DctP
MTTSRLLCAIALGLISLPSLAQGPILLKFSHVVAPDTPKGKAALKFKELAEARTKGAVKVEVYPNSQLAKDQEEMGALQLNAVQMLAPSVSKFGPIGVREFEVFDLPYIIPDRATLYRVTEGEIGQQLFARLEAKGIRGLAYWDNGFKHMSANRPLHKLADMRGLKVRIQSSKVLEAQMKALGAIPRAMAFSETYTALQQGVVDGTENTLSNMYTQKMHEVQKYLTLSEHGYILYAVIVNKQFWDGLPPKIRGELQTALADATRYEHEIARAENEAALAAIKAAKTTEVTVQPPEERKRWREALLPVHRKFEDTVGKDTIEAFYAAAAQK